MKIKSIACIGDSITEGWGLADPKNECFPALLVQAFPDLRIDNYGVAGALLQSQFDMGYVHTSAFRKSLEYDYDLVMIFLGANDVWYWTSQPTIQEELIYLIEQYPHALKLLITPLKMQANSFAKRKLETIRQIMFESAQQDSIFVLDLYRYSSIDWLSLDGIHPTRFGQAEIVHIIRSYLEQTIFPAQ